MNPQVYCQELVKKSGSNFATAFRFMSVPQREAITAVYAFCASVDDIADTIEDKDVARAKIQWWAQEIDRLYRQVPQHPISKALLGPIKQFDLEQSWFLSLLKGMIWDIEGAPIESTSDLELYCYHVAGVVGFISASIMGVTSLKTLDFAESLGQALQWVNMIRDIGEDARNGRIYFPTTRFEAYGVTREMIYAGKNTPEISAYLAFEAQAARECYQKALSLLPLEDRENQRPALVMAEIYFALLEELALIDFKVMDRKISLPKLRKLLIAWKTMRRETRLVKREKKLASLAAAGQV